MTPDEKQNLIESTVRMLFDVRQRIASLKAREEELTREIRELLPPRDEPYPMAEHSVLVKTGREFNRSIAESVLPSTVLDRISDRVINLTKAKSVLSPEVFEACRTPKINPTVRIEYLKD
jgi:hypothetical protein